MEPISPQEFNENSVFFDFRREWFVSDMHAASCGDFSSLRVFGYLVFQKKDLTKSSFLGPSSACFAFL
jgi:hypothetical protein